MTFQPRIFTFYSYKGGVGRSMALLNMAYYLHARGRHVLVVDLDLDAPGASGFLHRTNELLPSQGTGDVVDVLAAVVRSVRAAPAGAEPVLPALNLGAFFRSVDPKQYATPAHLTAPRARLDVLAADQKRDYPARLSALELPALSADQIAQTSDLLRGVLLRHRFPFQQPWQEDGESPEDTAYDYILVDSRTGLSEIGGLCVGPLSDRLIVLCGLNDQNIEGTRDFLNLVGLEPKARPATAQWDDADPSGEGGSQRPATLGPKPTLLVASPVPGGEMTYKKQRMEELEKKIGLRPVKLSYHPQMALMETLFIRDFTDEYLALEYATLADRIMSMVGDSSEQLQHAIFRLFRPSQKTASPPPELDALPKLLARDAVAGGSDLFWHKPDNISGESRDLIRRLSINLAPTPEVAASAWLEWADALDTEENRKLGDPAVFQSMEEKYQKALALKPDDHAALNNWGNALSDWAKLKKGAEADALFGQAADKFQKALALKPDKHEVLNNWGTALSEWAKRKQGAEADALFARAAEMFEKASAIKPDYVDVLFNLACLAGLQGDVAAAITTLERWKTVHPGAAKANLDGDTDFDRIRDDPRFQEFRERLPG